MPNYRKRGSYQGAYRRGAYGRGGFFSDAWTGVKKYGGMAAKAAAPALLKAALKIAGVGAYRPARRGAYRPQRGAYGRGAISIGRRSYHTRGAYGRGSYNEVSNGMLAPLPPSFKTSGKNDYVEICHREYIGDLYSSATAGAFSINSFYLNPSDTTTFPWLSQIAASSFQQYELYSCIFEFQSFSSDALNSTNTALGTVVAAINYDSTDAVPTTRGELENTDWSQAYKPSQSFPIPVECAPKDTTVTKLYTRQSNLIPSGEDRRLYDMGRLDIATLGCQGTSVNLGSLYITYKVRLYKTVQFAPLILADCYHYYNSTSITAGTNPIGVVANDTVVRNNLGAVHTSGTVITIPLGSLTPNAVYQICLAWTQSSGAFVAPNVTIAGGMAAFDIISNNGTSLNAAGLTNTGSTATGLYIGTFQVSATPTAAGTITFGTGGTFQTVTVIDVQINQLSGIANLNV